MLPMRRNLSDEEQPGHREGEGEGDGEGERERLGWQEAIMRNGKTVKLLSWKKARNNIGVTQRNTK